jgi:hypothetical protein
VETLHIANGKYLNQVRDTVMKKVPVQSRVVVPGWTFAEVVEGKRSETGTETREEGKMGNSEEVIQYGNC